MLLVRATFLLLACFAAHGANAEIYLTEGTNISVDVSADGRAAIDLLGGIWVLPADGGTASPVGEGLRPAQRPRWSPDGSALVYQASSASRDELWLHQMDSRSSERLDNGRHFNQHPSWHRDGERVVFSSDRNDSGFDLWEIDLETRLAWRLSSLPGDESEPMWSRDGRNLVYVHENDQRWSLMIRRHGLPDQVIATSTMRIAAPSWRPDGSLVTYTQLTPLGWTIRMAILSDPILNREIIAGEDIFVSPVAWPDRQQMLYTANGHIRKRPFNSWTSVTVPFRAIVGSTSAGNGAEIPSRDIPDIDTPTGTSIIRAARYYDGLGKHYQGSADIIIEGGRIVAIENQQDRDGTIVIDLGDLTVIPAFIDAYASLPADIHPSKGPLLLGLGLSTIVADHADADHLNTLWSGKDTPGPRVLRAMSINNVDESAPLPWLLTVSGDMSAGVAQREAVRRWRLQGIAVLADSWQVGLGSGASLLIGTGTMPTSPAGRSYQDVQMASRSGAVTLVSGLADRNTPELDAILNSRIARLLSPTLTVTRRFASSPDLSSAATSVVLGSAPNELPPGIAMHAELRGLAAAGLNGEQALKAAGVNAAAALGLGLRLGRIAPGAAADLLLVDGDPLGDIDDALRIVAVVRNGRFFSVSGLVDRAEQAARTADVE